MSQNDPYEFPPIAAATQPPQACPTTGIRGQGKDRLWAVLTVAY